uniref:Fibronectin type III domain protein n=2 Tax=Mesocestoides corti TaxID=53468 RepID=A0A5K3F9J3_MESCO
NRLSQSHLPRQKRSALPPPIPPGDLELVSVTEDNAQLSWHPPRPVAPPDDTGSGEQINYRVEIKPENSPRKFSVMTEEPRISFEELRPNTLYEISVYSYRPADGLASLTAKHIQVTTKAEVYRLPMVANPKAESTDFATLKVSWELPHVERSEKPEAQIAYYRIMLYNLAAEGTPHSRRWVPYKVPGGARVTAYTISNLQPDSFYKIRIFAVSAIGVDGHPATISSSPRIISRPPSGAPLEVVLSDVGALTAAFTWLPPHESERNGEIVAYQLEFNSPEWLAPRELTVADSLNYTITGLNPMTNYTLTIAAATRAGIGPKSSPLLFTTALKTSQIDKEVQEPREDSFDHPGFVDSGVATLPPLKVHNLRYVAQERNILLLWSIPPISASPHRFKGCIVRWGLIYPGPNKAEVNLEKRAFSIEPLEPSTTYMISVALLTDDGEGPVEIITAQTKPVSSAKDSLIPLNVRVLSVGTDWAIMAWDSPTCSALEDEFEASRASSRRTTQRASPCASGTFPLTYQLRYDIIDPKEAANVAFANCPDDSRKTASEVRVNVTWVRLEHLKAGSRYVACVRAITSDPSSASSAKTRIGDWSFVQIFETQEPESPPADPQAQGESTLSLVNQSSNETTPKPEKPSLNFNSSFVEGPRSSGLLGGGNSDIWLALAAIMVTTIVLMIIVIVVVCWAKRSPIMVVGYKPEQHGGGGGSLAEASVNLLSSSKGQRMGGGEAVGEKITLQKFSTSKAPENQLVDFTAKSQAETWTMDSDSMQIAVPASRAAVGPPVMGVRSAVDPMGGGGGGGGSDAASRGATGSSASSAVSLLPPTVGGKPNPSFVSPTGNPLINPGPNVPAYSMYPSAQPQLGTFAQTYYHQHQPPLQNSAIYPTPTTGGYIRGVANLPPVPPPPPFPPPSAAGTMITPSNIGGPRIDLRAGENDGTYLQYPVLPIYRGHMAVNAPCVNASDLISDS